MTSRAAGQCRRSLPGRRADLQALRASTARPWELSKTESSTSWTRSARRSASTPAAARCMRILPRINDDVNEEWISDKARHAVDGLRAQRLDRPYVRERRPAAARDLGRGFRAVAAKVTACAAERIGAIAGDLAAVEEMYALKDLSHGSARPTSIAGRTAPRSTRRAARSYLFNPTIAGIDAGRRVADHRLQPAPGSAGAERAHPQALAERQHQDRLDRRARRPDLSLCLSRRRHRRRSRASSNTPPAAALKRRSARRAGRAGPTRRRGGARRRRQGRRLVGGSAEDWNGFTVLHTAAARVGGLDLGFVPGEGGLDAQRRWRNGARRRAVPARRRRDRDRARDRSSSISALMAIPAPIAPT